MNKKPIFAILFYVLCFCLFFLFTLFAREKGWLSAEIYFFSFRSRILLFPSSEQAKNVFLTYPFLPFLFSLVSFLPTLIPPVIGTFTTLVLAKTIHQGSSSLFYIPLVVTSPFFLLSIFSPTFLLLGLFIAVAVSNIVRYHETQSIYFFFLGGIILGIGILNHTSLFWACIPIIIFQLLFFHFPISRKVSLLFVSLFPPLFFLGTLLFFHWVYSGNPLFFFNYASLSLGYAVPKLFFPSSINIARWFLGLWFVFPLLTVLCLQGLVRLFWAVSALTLSFILFRNMPVSLPISFLIIFSVLLWRPKSTFLLRTGAVLLLFISALGWFQLVRGEEAFFSLNHLPLQDKILDYQHIEDQVDLSSASILVLDQYYFLSACWKYFAHSVVPESDSFDQICHHPEDHCSYVLIDKEKVDDSQEILDNYHPLWEGRRMVLYSNSRSIP